MSALHRLARRVVARTLLLTGLGALGLFTAILALATLLLGGVWLQRGLMLAALVCVAGWLAWPALRRVTR